MQFNINGDFMNQNKLNDLLNQNDDYDFINALIDLVYGRYAETEYENLNEVQRTLYLCCLIEDCCQADTLYTFIEEGMGKYLSDAVKSYDRIGAPKTSALLKQIINITPQNVIDGESPTDEILDKIIETGSLISDYPDGVMHKIYFDYAKKHSTEIL
ncbi:MAG: hypothetical protein K2K91_02940 [Ruminococcus sp.]|nr:hypothetical protein [Ruminococcus sp.]MDE7099215.1 hypothetical protein [Ruminococcus sp.]